MAVLNYGWPYICAKFSMHQSEEANSHRARDYELMGKSHLDNWESIRFLFKGPGVLHSVCCSSINVGFLDHVYIRKSLCKLCRYQLRQTLKFSLSVPPGTLLIPMDKIG